MTGRIKSTLAYSIRQQYQLTITGPKKRVLYPSAQLKEILYQYCFNAGSTSQPFGLALKQWWIIILNELLSADDNV